MQFGRSGDGRHGGLAFLHHKNLRHIHRIKAVLRAAELTTHLDGGALLQDVCRFVSAQATDHLGHPLAAAVAGEAGPMFALFGRKTQQFFFPEQAVQDGVHIQRQQFIARQGGGQVGDAVVVFVLADLVFVLAVGAARSELGMVKQGEIYVQYTQK